MKLIEQALQLASDIDEYAPQTNIATIIRELVQVIVQQEKVINETITASKSKAKSSKS
jgi:hypothetical protein